MKIIKNYSPIVSQTTNEFPKINNKTNTAINPSDTVTVIKKEEIQKNNISANDVDDIF
ncbi:MAG: hypothetical protein U9Q66_04645 [Patescibacteria group bacterium]|nr:hypothetical protein [Patescibacteria group bacterium]